MADEKLVNQAVEMVENLCGPDKMSKEDAVDFLEDVIGRLENSIEAIKEELGEEENDV